MEELRNGIEYYDQAEIRPEWVMVVVQEVKKQLIEQYLLENPEILNQEDHMLMKLYQKQVNESQFIQPTPLEQKHLTYVQAVLSEMTRWQSPSCYSTEQKEVIIDQFRKTQEVRGKWQGLTSRDYGYLESFCIEQVKQSQSPVLTPGQLVMMARPFTKVDYQSIEQDLLIEYYESAFCSEQDLGTINPIFHLIQENTNRKNYRNTEQRSPFLFTVVRNAALQLFKEQVEFQRLMRMSETLQGRETIVRLNRRKEYLEQLLNEKQRTSKNYITNEENIFFLLNRKLPHGTTKQNYNLTVLEYFALLEIPPQELLKWKKLDPQWQALNKRLIYFIRNNTRLLQKINYRQKETITTRINDVMITPEINAFIYQTIDQLEYPRIEGIYYEFCKAYVNNKLDQLTKKQVRSRMIRTLSQVPKTYKKTTKN